MLFLFIFYGIVGGYVFWKIFQDTEIFRDVYSSKIRGAGILILPVVLWFMDDWRVALCVLTLSAMGIYDDIKGLDGRIKLLITLFVSTFIVYSFAWGLPINLADTEIYIPLLNEVFWLAFMVGFTNAFNVIDGKDGMLISTSLSSLLFIFLITGSNLWIYTSAVLVGILLYNSPPAKIIMGDTGSYILGFLISYGFLKVSYVPFEAILLVLLYPLMDSLTTFTRRLLSGKNIFRRDEEHIHHRITRILGDKMGLGVIFSLNFLSASMSWLYFSSGKIIYLVPGFILWMLVVLWLYNPFKSSSSI